MLEYTGMKKKPPIKMFFLDEESPKEWKAVINNKLSEYSEKAYINLKTEGNENILVILELNPAENELNQEDYIIKQKNTFEKYYDKILEETEIKAIAHKDQLIVLSVKCEYQEISQIIKSLNTEVFESMILKGNLHLIIESKYLESISTELSGRDFVVNSKKYAMVSITGIRVANDKDFISQLIDELNKLETQVHQLNQNGLGISLLIDQDNLRGVLDFVHKKYLR